MARPGKKNTYYKECASTNQEIVCSMAKYGMISCDEEAAYILDALDQLRNY